MKKNKDTVSFLESLLNQLIQLKNQLFPDPYWWVLRKTWDGNF